MIRDINTTILNFITHSILVFFRMILHPFKAKQDTFFLTKNLLSHHFKVHLFKTNRHYRDYLL